ncbi:MAG: beta-propeller domain-containing protein [Burkholderiales bacterium]|nr:beta-propeller domain-containing protein [Burkholderiales bacterium]
MKKHLLFALALAAAFAQPASALPTPSRKTLPAFASEQELADLFKGWSEEARRRVAARRASRADGPAMAIAKSELAQAPAAAAKEAESVTNVQHAGVDEGGIVKLHGDHLVILRRGRLFTVAVNDRQLRPVSYANAYGEGIEPRGAWYDEMLLWDDTVVVIGYSYARGGTEIGLFRISAEGELTHRATYHLRSNDYYSSRNYASRLVGSKLVFYTPLYLNPWHGNYEDALPALRRWRPGATSAEFRRIAPATRIYRSDEPLDPFRGLALHSVTVCDLAQAEMSCESAAVLGPRGRVFYVSAGSVYVWNVNSAVFRIPLDGSAPSALKANGSPVDQFSFLEGEDGYLNVLVRSSGRGEGMWGAESRPGALSLLRVPLASFSDGRDAAPPHAYRPLPRTEGHALQSRYVGDYLLYGTGAGWRRPAGAADGRPKDAPLGRVYAVDYARGGQAHEVPLPHGVDRIEALGAHAVAVGSDGRNLHFTSLRLARTPAASGSYVRANAAQGETRSHGFFYKAEGGEEGIIGLPVIGGGESAGRQLRRESAAVLYLRNRSLALSELGELEARAGGAEDHCRASCVDWYGNSRPLFLRGRVFALLGYEIVEGRLRGGRILEANRVHFAPATVELAR